MQFHEKLYILRKQHGFTQQQLGEKLELSQSFVRKLEHRIKKPNASHLLKISDVFGVPIDVLVRDELDLDVNNEPL